MARGRWGPYALAVVSRRDVEAVRGDKLRDCVASGWPLSGGCAPAGRGEMAPCPSCGSPQRMRERWMGGGRMVVVGAHQAPVYFAALLPAAGGDG